MMRRKLTTTQTSYDHLSTLAYLSVKRSDKHGI